VARALAANDLPEGSLELELTEGLLMQHSAENVQVLQSLAQLGVRLAVDDFGTGYSNLGYLRRFPIQTLKIDQSFVHGIGQDSHDTAIVATIMAMAHALRLKVIAEGVQTEAQAACLFHHGCVAAQGYLYSPPVPPAALTAMLARQAAGRWAFEGTC
jgi:EAL domain-containing protein (putative c-di-GMP-specific phosphodiesterase class I)